MPRPIRLRRLLRPTSPLAEALAALDAAGHRVVVRDAAGTALFEPAAPGPGAAERPDLGAAVAEVSIDGTVLGSVQGDAAAIVAPVVQLVAEQAHLERALGAEVLDLYRQRRALVDLTSMLSAAIDPADVANALVASVARAVAATVSFVDTDRSIVATTDPDAPAPSTPGASSAADDDVSIRTVDDASELLVRVSDARQTFGWLAARRPGHTTESDATEFAAADADFLGTLAVIAAAAFARAAAHQRELRASEQRSRELEATVERLRTELDLATTKVLATVVFTDLVDSTATQSRLGDAAWARIIEAHNQEASRLIEEAGGTLIEFTGDGFFAWFDSPSRALACARGHRDAVRALGLDLRAGVHTGEVEQRGRRVSGLAVNIAARVMGLADDGEIRVSSVTAEVLRTSDHVFEPKGESTLKGVPGRWTTCALVDTDDPA